jgi:tRNA-dihydrouridine synthase
MAPIRGITDHIYRSVFPKFFSGFDKAVAPFLATSHKNKLKGNLIKNFAPELNTGIATIPQILSKNHEDFIPLANSLFELGYTEINWNIGCPYPMVTNKGKGSGMLPLPEKIDSFLDKVTSDTKAQISIKLRLGLEYHEQILQLIPIFNKYPLKELIIHPRTARQMYSGTVNLDIFKKSLSLSKHSIVYNGDINSALDLLALQKELPTINKWMIGRGVLRNPFLVEELMQQQEKSNIEKKETIYKFHDALYSEYRQILSGATHITDKMKAVWFYLSNIFENEKKVHKLIKKTSSLEKYHQTVEKIFRDFQITTN